MIGVIGLGLIGGSLAKALNQNTDYSVYGYDIDRSVLSKAKLVGAIEDELKEDMLCECDIVIVALYPSDTVDYVRSNAEKFKKGSLVIDCCGVKKTVCSILYPLSQKHGFIFMGGHPMAGLEHSGFEYSKKALFDKASMILVPPAGIHIKDLEKIKSLCSSIGFSNIQISTADEHDRMIAFTSQLAHVTSNAYIKSSTASRHAGFSAGSYYDMTRVAKLNEKMWTELFLENPEYLSCEIQELIDHLGEYKNAIDTKDRNKLAALLKDGREKKEKIDNEFF
ncbi:MAG: prephenate dehydrogenase [Eubacteriales bacterium]|nr:prephenate dehydrogenase [Eubacteriales bacterium]